MTYDVDPDGPRPMEYYAAREWDALNSGKPPPPAMGVPYAMPTEYHARMRYLERYEKSAQRRR